MAIIAQNIKGFTIAPMFEKLENIENTCFGISSDARWACRAFVGQLESALPDGYEIDDEHATKLISAAETD